MGMTSLHTTYTDKSTSNDVGDTTHWDAANANYLSAAVKDFDTFHYRTQSVDMKSSGTTIIVPTWQVNTPVSLSLCAKDTTANSMIVASCLPTGYASTGVTVTHGTAAADGSALATIFYA